MRRFQPFPTSAVASTHLLPASDVFSGGSSGDGGNRTHDLFPPSWARGLPIFRSDGAIRCFAWVDLADFERFSAHRWQIQVGRYGYVYRPIVVDGRRRKIYLHRLVLGLADDDLRKGDHVNRDLLDCRRANLRIVTDAENAQNQGSRGGSSRYRGVSWDKSRQKWLASGTLDGRRRTVGRFDSEDDAGAAAAAWRRAHMPFSEEAAWMT